MPEESTIEEDYNALNELIVNCPDFDKLESLLGGFNLFQVLKFEHGEIRHSNVLAWILDPMESHGLDSTFLKKWLMRVIHEGSEANDAPISAVDIDAWQLSNVDVRREWQNIDLLLVLTFSDGDQWIVCIENKIHSTQHSNQLRRYKECVEEFFPDANRRIFIFLTKGDEQPDDDSYIPASYTQVHNALKECVESRFNAIGTEPRVLLENYLRLLEEKFMDESEIARTALRIYQQHRRALDVIFEHRPDNLRNVTDRLTEKLSKRADEFGITVERSSKAYVRFTPKAWNQPGNTHGNAWAGNSRTVLFEISLSGKRPYLNVVCGMAPDNWINPLWELSESAPFQRQKRAERPRMWCTVHFAGKKKQSVDLDQADDPDQISDRILEWTIKSMQSEDTQQVIDIIAKRLPDLEKIYTAQSA